MNLKIIADALLGIVDFYPDFEPKSIKISKETVYCFSDEDEYSISANMRTQMIIREKLDND